MPSKSKTKGNAFERDVSKFLNRVYNTDGFTKTMGSGAFVGKGNWAKRSGLDQNIKVALAGDIITPTWFPFSIECKHYSDTPNYATIIKGPDVTLDSWLGKSIHDAINTQLIPLVFFKTDYKGAHVALPREFAPLLEKMNIRYFLTYRCFVIVGIDQFEYIGTHLLDEVMKDEGAVKRTVIDYFTQQLEDTTSEVFFLYNSFYEDETKTTKKKKKP